jgi:Fe-S cluster assembly ATP-binding protein
MTLEIKDLHASIGDKEILKGLTLTLPIGQVAAIMGPNGSGKSTLSKVLAGHEDYTVTKGEVLMDGRNLLEMSVEDRSRAGFFLAFQYPMEIPGVSNANFLRAALQARLPDGEQIDAVQFYQTLYKKMDQLKMDRSFTARSVNEGFSGGEKKRNEILQMLMLEPRYAVLDETDSGLDIDALKIVAEGVNLMRSPQRGILLITHYQRLLDHIKPDVVHVLSDGRIVKTGGPDLALKLEAQGYDWLKAA